MLWVVELIYLRGGKREHFVWSMKQLLPSPLPLYFSTVPLFIRVGVGAHDWVVKFCQPAVQSPSRSQQGKPQDVSGTQPPLSNTVVDTCNNSVENDLHLIQDLVVTVFN